MSAIEHFDIADDLPEKGTTLLEASAGTGKTWTIAALVTRYVAEGVVTLPEMLVVTFGRAASQELRARVREQLVEAAHALAHPPAPERRDALMNVLFTVDGTEVGDSERLARLRRVREALASFDSATIATTHQFCQQVLRGLGVAGDTDPETQLVEDLDDLLVEVVDDLYLRQFAAEDAPAFSRTDALMIAREAVDDAHADLRPSDAERGSTPDRRARFARAVRTELDLRKRRLRVMHYNDLLIQLADALEADDAPARARMRARWKVVLVDEFQDTDPVQWQVLDRAFTGHAAMVLIGDPKQAIYLFRGGDVVNYLAAADTADHQRTLPRNFRSDEPLVQALDVLMRGAQLGDERIEVRPVEAHLTGTRLHGAPHPAPVRLRQVRAEHVRGPLLVGPIREHIASDLARDIAELLASGATFDDSDGPRPLRARDVAVVATTNARLLEFQAALRAVGIHAVTTGGSSVLLSRAAHDWLTLLEAMAAPHRSALTRAAALTPLLGMTAAQLDGAGPSESAGLGDGTGPQEAADIGRGDAAGDNRHAGADLVGTARPGDGAELRGGAGIRQGARLETGLSEGALQRARDELDDELASRLRTLADVYTRQGLAAVYEALAVAGLPARVLATVGGERELTDIRHVAELLHETSDRGRVGLTGLIEWLRTQMAKGAVQSAGERTRRLDSDATAVQLVTVHGSKGLQYPVVYAPTLWDRYTGTKDPSVARFHDDPPHRVRCLDVGGSGGPFWAQSAAKHREQEGQESLRLLYVALTRAQSQVVLWWAGTKNNTPASPLQRMLLGRAPGQAEVPPFTPVSSDDDVADVLSRWAQVGALSLEQAVPAPLVQVPTAPAAPALSIGTFTRRIDHDWRRTSYTALSTPRDADGLALPTGGVGSEPEAVPRDDEPELPVPVDALAEMLPGLALAGADVPSPMADLPVGATFGSLVHAVLEHADPHAPDLRDELLQHITEQLVWWPVDLSPDELADALVAVCDTPLGPLASGATLHDIGHSDRLCELDFELPLGGGDLRRPAHARKATSRGTDANTEPAGPDFPAEPAHARKATSRGTDANTQPAGPDLPAEPAHARKATSRGTDANTQPLGLDRPAGPRPTQVTRTAVLGDLAPLLRTHLRDGDPVRRWADALDAQPAMAEQELRGYLTGSVDVVLRTGGTYLVVDYKTNWLGPLDEPLTAAAYRPEALDDAMGHSSYPLQALLYAVVAHRFLRWRLPGYTPKKHLGGVLYLYVRGMCGPDTPVIDGHPCGVFSWRPPVALVTAVSDLLDGGEA